MRTHIFKTSALAQTAIFLAILIFLALTPLGFLFIPGLFITISFLGVVVTAGAIVVNPKTSLFLGFVYGLISITRCFGLDPLGTLMMNTNLWVTILMNLLPRIIVAYLTSLLFISIKYNFKRRDAVLISSLLAPILNAIFFFITLFWFSRVSPEISSILQTGQKSATLDLAILVCVCANMIVEILVSVLVSTPIITALLKSIKKKKQ